MKAVRTIAAKMSPDFRGATEAAIEGVNDSATLHAARIEIARFTDRIVGRGRSGRMTPARQRMIATGREAYDEIAATLAKRGEL